MTSLADQMTPCGPVRDARAADHIFDALAEAAMAGGWHGLLEKAREALAPVFAASSYLGGLARRRPAMVAELLACEPKARLEDILARTARAGLDEREAGRKALRVLKAETHLLTALCDLGGVWDLDDVTGAITRFADAACEAALRLVAADEIAAGRMIQPADDSHGPVPGFFCLAMGKQGAFELNYSSDIDISIFYEPEILPLAGHVEPETFADRLTRGFAQMLQERTPDGYVFRVDLRLRPDPSSTPPAVPAAAAFEYYESVGQNWERAAFIKARPVAGDLIRARAFLTELQPFIWRRNLDFAAIADIHSIKRQIHAYKVDERLAAKGADLKLGRGGIREVEFYVQTQQLILGGRHPELRSNRTLAALDALTAEGHVSHAARDDLKSAYIALRALEHRSQMIADEQTHKLPEAAADRSRIAALWGHGDLRRFDAAVEQILKKVNRRYGELFPDDEDLSSRFGSLIFTGVDDDPETLATLGRMGFSNPPRISGTIRAWHHGHIAATRTERGRELFTRLAPRLLEAAQATGAPDDAFNRFGDFFSGLSSGVQVQSLFLAQPDLFQLVVRVMAFAPELARTLARRPAALDALLDPAFFAPFDPADDRDHFEYVMAQADGFEAAMDAARRLHREQAFRIGLKVIAGTASADDAGRAFADLADLCIVHMADAALKETERLAGAFPGEVAVVALGKCGSREMSAGSDLDLMALYLPADGGAQSALKGWSAETFYARFTQRLVAALSAPTAEGGLYEVDLRLRPSGTSGPVAVSFAAFEDYYADGAETWEFLAMTRARVVWATSEGFATECRHIIEKALRQARVTETVAAEVLGMRELMARERPPKGYWDLKLSAGGLVDIEFAVQYLQLAHAHEGGPLSQNTGEALRIFEDRKLGPQRALDCLRSAFVLQQSLTQLLKVALEDGADPSLEPAAFKTMLAKAGGVRDFRALTAKLNRVRQAAHQAFMSIVHP
ncbi:MAG: bifunctional [glutamine synthetase] adenylyltransferase/[glutamine synthetase]-adenylyl-L-tyrosine phosphorylase [Caulobacteraceae bacterium]